MEDFILQPEVAREFLRFFHDKTILCESVDIHPSKEAVLDGLIYTQELEWLNGMRDCKPGIPQ